jgi:hypothetical protein
MFLAASPLSWQQLFAQPELADAREQSHPKEIDLHEHGPPLLRGDA